MESYDSVHALRQCINRLSEENEALTTQVQTLKLSVHFLQESNSLIGSRLAILEIERNQHTALETRLKELEHIVAYGGTSLGP